MLVRDVMRKPISVHAEETLEVATLRLKKENVGALPVVEDDQVVGMITDRDLLLRGFPEGRNIIDIKVMRKSQESLREFRGVRRVVRSVGSFTLYGRDQDEKVLLRCLQREITAQLRL
jgi:predicted transcriptional regulator